MLLLIDFNNLMWRTMHAKDVEIKSDVPDVNLWKLMIFDSIYASFTRDDRINEVVLAVDDKNQWRKTYFSRYKETRKTKREKTGIDFTFVFDTMNQYLADLKHGMPFKVLKIRAAEADDIIGILASNLKRRVIISSNDEDYTQCISDNVVVWNPSKRKYVKCADTEKFLQIKSLTGQSKDDIYNVKTPKDWGHDDKTFGKRRPGLGPVMAEKILKEGLKEWLLENNVTHRYMRNRNLIDFKKIPPTICNRVLKTYDNYNFPPPRNMYEFLKKFNFRNFLDSYHIVESCLMRLY